MNEVGGLQKHVFTQHGEPSPTEGRQGVDFLPGEMAETVAELGADQAGELLAGVLLVTGTGQATFTVAVIPFDRFSAVASG